MLVTAIFLTLMCLLYGAIWHRCRSPYVCRRSLL